MDSNNYNKIFTNCKFINASNFSDITDNFNSTIDLNDTMDITECSYIEPLESIFEENAGRVSLAYENLTDIPQYIADTFSMTLRILDLSYNRLNDLTFLTNIRYLHTLVLDRNTKPDESTLPYLPNLKILWLNNCDIINIPKWINRIKLYCPNIKQLSLMGNVGAYSLYDNAMQTDHTDYRMFVIKTLPALEYLDDTLISNTERSNSQIYKLHIGPMRFVERFGSAYLLNIFRKSKRNKSKNGFTSSGSQSQ